MKELSRGENIPENVGPKELSRRWTFLKMWDRRNSAEV
jgi:hypothetical protein